MRTANLVAPAAARALLLDVLERCRRAAPTTIAVFDLDSTLLNNRPRQARILREYGRDHGIAALARARTEHWTGWDFAAAMRNAGLDDAAVEQNLESFRGFWRERFFTSAYCVMDVPIPGAVAYVRAVRDTGARVTYVTGRHEAMRQGTVACFRKAGFPLPDEDRVFLLMKPTLEENDDDYKARTHDALERAGTVAAVFDNEPTHINGYRIRFPQALLVHLATDHSLRPITVHADIPSIPNFCEFAAAVD
jgi:hypothetical protein